MRRVFEFVKAYYYMINVSNGMSEYSIHLYIHTCIGITGIVSSLYKLSFLIFSLLSLLRSMNLLRHSKTELN